MDIITILLLAAIALIIYLIAAHKIDTSKLHSKVDGFIAGLAHSAVIKPAAAASSAPADPATVVAAALGAPKPAAAPAAPAAPAAVIFDPAAYPDPATRASAAQQLASQEHAKRGNYNFKIVDPLGNEIDVRGNPILPPPEQGWQPGPTLNAFGVGRQNVYAAGVPFPYTISVPSENFSGGGFEFVWSQCPGTLPGDVKVTVTGVAGTFQGAGNTIIGSVAVRGAKPGETYVAMVEYSVGQPGHAQINPLS